MQLLIGAVRYMKWYEVKIWQSYIETCIQWILILTSLGYENVS